MADRSLTDITTTLLRRADATGDRGVLYDEADRWPSGALDALVEIGVLQAGASSTGLVCDGCEEACWVTPSRRTKPGAGVVLVHPCHARDGMGHIFFDVEYLCTWQLDIMGLARGAATGAGFEADAEEVSQGSLWRLATIGGGRNRRSVYLAVGLSTMRGAERAELLQRHTGPGKPIIIAPASAPADVPEAQATFFRAEEVLTVTMDGIELAVDVFEPPPSMPRLRKRVDLPVGTDWENLVIRVMDNENVQAVIGRREVPLSYVDLGLVDGRTASKTPSEVWGFFLAIAKAGGSMTWRDKTASDNNRRRKCSLAGALREVFGLDTDPFKPYRTSDGWRPKFTLVDHRDSA